MDTEPTHALPQELERKLIEAKGWYDQRGALEATIRQHGGIAERNQTDRDDLDREAAGLLEAIVEIIDETWGFA